MPLDQYTAKGYYNPRSKNKKVLNQSNWKDMKFSTGCSSGASQIYKKSIYIYISYIYIQYIHETTHKSRSNHAARNEIYEKHDKCCFKSRNAGGYGEKSWRDHGDDSLWFVSTRLLYSQLLMSVLQAFFKIISYQGKDSVAKIGTHCIPTFADRCMNIRVNYNKLRKPQKI